MELFKKGDRVIFDGSAWHTLYGAKGAVSRDQTEGELTVSVLWDGETSPRYPYGIDVSKVIESNS